MCIYHVNQIVKEPPNIFFESKYQTKVCPLTFSPRRRKALGTRLVSTQFLLGHFKSLLPMPRWVFHSSASTGSFKSKETIDALHHGDHIDDMTKKWLSLTPNPTRIPVFYTLTNIHKPNPVGRPIISGCEGPTERISSCGSPTSAYC